MKMRMLIRVIVCLLVGGLSFGCVSGHGNQKDEQPFEVVYECRDDVWTFSLRNVSSEDYLIREAFTNVIDGVKVVYEQQMGNETRIGRRYWSSNSLSEIGVRYLPLRSYDVHKSSVTVQGQGNASNDHSLEGVVSVVVTIYAMPVSRIGDATFCQELHEMFLDNPIWIKARPRWDVCGGGIFQVTTEEAAGEGDTSESFPVSVEN